MTDEQHPPDSPFDIAAFLKELTTRPGVYRMIDANGTVMYVGKAKNLKNAFHRISRKPMPARAPAIWWSEL